MGFTQSELLSRKLVVRLVEREALSGLTNSSKILVHLSPAILAVGAEAPLKILLPVRPRQVIHLIQICDNWGQCNKK